MKVSETRNTTLHNLWNTTDTYNTLNHKLWQSKTEEIILKYQQFIITSIKEGYDSRTVSEGYKKKKKKWNFSIGVLNHPLDGPFFRVGVGVLLKNIFVF